MRYTVIFEQENDGGYVVSIPALPGCHSQGDTREEALQNIAEAAAAYVDHFREMGEPIPREVEIAALEIDVA